VSPANHATPWHPTELQMVRDRYPAGDITKLCEDLGRSLPSVQTQARVLGVRRDKALQRAAAAAACLQSRAPEDTSGIVSAAIAARTLIEQAWACPL
jgi:hypothetical protein